MTEPPVTGRGGEQRIPRPVGAQAGGAPPWSGLAAASRHLSLASVRARLETLPPPQPPELVAPGSRGAAVLVPLFEADGEARVILTKRPETMPSHRGEIAFPGGKFEPAVDTSLRDTALREAEEEVGLRREHVEVIAQLDSLATVASRFHITPFVGALRDRPALTADPREVVSVFDVVLADLLDDDAYREERWDLFGAERSIYFYELPGETIWGATARILTALLTHLTANL